MFAQEEEFRGTEQIFRLFLGKKIETNTRARERTRGRVYTLAIIQGVSTKSEYRLKESPSDEM